MNMKAAGRPLGGDDPVEPSGGRGRAGEEERMINSEVRRPSLNKI